MIEMVFKEIAMTLLLLIAMVTVSFLFDSLYEFIVYILEKFYATKVGYYFERYKLIERIVLCVFVALLLIGTLLMGREMIAHYRR